MKGLASSGDDKKDMYLTFPASWFDNGTEKQMSKERI